VAKERLSIGDCIDGFRVEELLHTGGMAHLWRVTHGSDRASLLMKTPVLYDGEDPAAIVGFEMEQMIMPRLKGPHVPRFVANGDFATQPYIVMEHIAGTSLSAMQDKLPLPVDDVVEIGTKVAGALDSLHRQRVVHLDIKPANVMFRPGGEAVLIDFGLSRHLDLPDLMGEEFRLPYGSAPYMAPEQVLGVRHDTRSDLFALGALMYFFATGEMPFGNPQKLKGLKRRLWQDPRPPRQINSSLFLWFQEIVLRCLEVNAARRHPTAAQLQFDLQHPSGVRLTTRAHKEKPDGFFANLRRKSEPLEHLIDRSANPTTGLATAPIVVVAIDLGQLTPLVSEALRHTVARVLERASDARVACLNVLKQSRVTVTSALDEKGQHKHVARIVQLKDWARELDVGQGRVSFHVLEAADPAEAILDYARANNVDHIVMAARGNSTLRKLLGSVSGKVATEAPCTVTVVRERRRQD
jgi:eukaryotic-like serine/threonine-protein kinase